MSLINSFIPSLNRNPSRQDGNSRPNDLGPTVKPLYEVKETDDAFGVTVYLPGVTKDTLP